MCPTTVREIEASIDDLSLTDQIRLFQYLTAKIALASLNTAVDGFDADQALQRFHAVGDRLRATSLKDAPELTRAVSEQRR